MSKMTLGYMIFFVGNILFLFSLYKYFKYASLIGFGKSGYGSDSVVLLNEKNVFEMVYVV